MLFTKKTMSHNPGKGKRTTSTLLDKPPSDDEELTHLPQARPCRTCGLMFVTLLVTSLASLFGYVAYKGQTTPCPNANLSLGLYTEAISLTPLIIGFLLVASNTDSNDSRVGGHSGAIFACCVCVSIVGFVSGAVITSIEKHKTGCDLLTDGAPCNSSCPHLWVGVQVWFVFLVSIASLMVLVISCAAYRGSGKKKPVLETMSVTTGEDGDSFEKGLEQGKDAVKKKSKKEVPSMSF